MLPATNRTTTVIDPGKNKIVYYFQNDRYLVGKDVYQNTGTVSSPVYTLLSSDTICYQANTTNCRTTAVSSSPVVITQRDTYHYTGSNPLAMSHSTQVLDMYGNVTSSTVYDYITGQTLVTTTTYTGCGQGTSIQDHPCDVKTVSGSNTLSEKKFSYNTAGAMTQSQTWTGSSWLVTNYAPNANGTTASITAPIGQVTNIGHDGSCNGLVPTSTSTTINGVVLQTSQTWDCNGGVVLTRTDASGNGTVVQYDSMFRPTMTQDKMGQQTTFAYTATSTSRTDPMGVYSIKYVDGMGRDLISQTRQSPTSSNYDTVSYKYDGWQSTADFKTETSVPCVTTLDQTCPTTTLSVCLLHLPKLGRQGDLA